MFATGGNYGSSSDEVDDSVVFLNSAFFNSFRNLSDAEEEEIWNAPERLDLASDEFFAPAIRSVLEWLRLQHPFLLQNITSHPRRIFSWRMGKRLIGNRVLLSRWMLRRPMDIPICHQLLAFQCFHWLIFITSYEKKSRGRRFWRILPGAKYGHGP